MNEKQRRVHQSARFCGTADVSTFFVACGNAKMPGYRSAMFR